MSILNMNIYIQILILFLNLISSIPIQKINNSTDIYLLENTKWGWGGGENFVNLL